VNEQHAPWFKLFWAWMLVGASNLTLLEWGQLIAACAATVYSVVQTVRTLRSKSK
jgi:hypothetical protein